MLVRYELNEIIAVKCQFGQGILKTKRKSRKGEVSSSFYFYAYERALAMHPDILNQNQFSSKIYLDIPNSSPSDLLSSIAERVNINIAVYRHSTLPLRPMGFKISMGRASCANLIK